MDLRDLSILDQRFDLVVLNRCIQFFEDPAAMTAAAAERLAEGGLLVVTGLEIFADPSGRRQQVAAMLERHRQHGISPFIPIKGYLDMGDRRRLEAAGLDLRAYPQLRMRSARVRSWLDRTRGRPCFGVLERGRLDERGPIGSPRTEGAAAAAGSDPGPDHARDR